MCSADDIEHSGVLIQFHIGIICVCMYIYIYIYNAVAKDIPGSHDCTQN